MDETTRLTLALNAAAEAMRTAESSTAEAVARFEHAQRRTAERGHRFSIVRAINAAATDGLRTGFEAEISQELARQAGTAHDINRPWLPWSAFGARTLVVGTASSGGYLVGSEARPAQAALFAASGVIRLGAVIDDGRVGTANYPRISANGTATWLAENGTAAASQPTLGNIACTPKTVGGYTELSRNLLLQGGQAEGIVSRHLLGLAGAALDAAVLAGTSTDSTVPLGIRYTSSITLTTGTSYDAAAAVAQVKAAASANLVDESIKFCGTPAVRELLAKRAANGTGSRYLWDDNMLASKPAFVNGNAPASTLFCGDFSTVVIPTWGNGLQIETNPYANFQAGIISLRVFLSADVAVTVPQGFAVSVSIT